MKWSASIEGPLKPVRSKPNGLWKIGEAGWYLERNWKSFGKLANFRKREPNKHGLSFLRSIRSIRVQVILYRRLEDL